MQNSNLNMLANRLKQMKNPSHVGPSIGIVVSVSPVTVSIAGGSILLKEGDELFVSDRLKDKEFDCVIKIEGQADQEGKIVIKPDLQIDEMVFVVPMDGEQIWVAVDRVGDIA